MLGRLLDGRYQVTQILSAGGFGKTYIAEDTRRPGNPKCVVKHLKPVSNDPNSLQTARRLFISEAETLESLGNHDQIPRLLAYFEQEREFFLVQEFIEGRSLSVELQSGESWTESQVIQLLKDVLAILTFVHNYGVIHRDIKPDNLIRRASDSKLVLIDFGAIKQVRSQIATPHSPMNATVAIGTPGYMPSEQGLGRPHLNSDIYALGIIAIQALTRLYPSQLQEDPTTGEMLWQHQVQVSEGFASILNRMVRYDYRDRYQSANEVLQAIEQLMSACPPTQLPSTAQAPVLPTQPLLVPPSRLARVRVATSSNRLPLLMGGSLAAVVGVVTAIAFKSRTASPPLVSSIPDSTPRLTSSGQTISTPASTPKVTTSPETNFSPDFTPKSTISPSNTTPATSLNEFDKTQFPRATCGDSLPTNSSASIQFYPVFIEYSDSNLKTVKSNFCADAYKKIRRDTGIIAIQVASFSNRIQAELFSDFMKRKLGNGDVGKPTSYSVPKSSLETSAPKNCPVVVFDPNSPLNVRAMPDIKFGKVVGTLKNGTPLSVITEQNGWFQISSPVQGWIAKNRTKVVCPPLR
jgi:serine/threonine protein kinase